ncbi:MAG: hypothetical protein LKE40_00205 [Spirochaetia bacterium]|jgi:hypothetical protein|nr:hypothetical protein [Spirochaetia bacterium]
MSQMSKYRIYHRKQDVGKKIEQLHRSEQLAIGIIDVGTLEQLKTTLSRYISEMNCCLHAIISSERGDIATLLDEFPDVTFIVFNGLGYLGELINAVADECFTTYFMIVRTDMELVRFDGAYILSLFNDERAPGIIVPAIANSNKEIIPSMRSPRLTGNLIDPDSYFPVMSDTGMYQSLYPFKGIGFYDRALFQRLRGFDFSIPSEYWQCLDLGLRCNQFGNTIGCTSSFIMSFPDRLSIIEDRSPVEGMNKVHTRALGVETINGKNFAHKFRGHFDRKTFNEEVKKRTMFLIKKDWHTLCATWQYPKEDKTEDSGKDAQ